MQTGNQQLSNVLLSSDDEQRVEIVIEQHEGEGRVALRSSTWTDGLGWCTQKTIHLNAAQLDELHRTITVARHRLNRQRAEAGEPVQTAQIIQLPNVA